MNNIYRGVKNLELTLGIKSLKLPCRGPTGFQEKRSTQVVMEAQHSVLARSHCTNYGGPPSHLWSK